MGSTLMQYNKLLMLIMNACLPQKLSLLAVFACGEDFPPVIKMTTMIHPMHMQMDRNLDESVAGILTCPICMKQTLQKGGIWDSRLCSLSQTVQMYLRTLIYLRLSLFLGINSNLNSEKANALARTESRFKMVSKQTVINTIF